ncbi:glycosyl hydrolase family 61-domain-containing protein [Mycena belliarum]|uniref:lytic cellulose monooxygenase (C4-dehydrogenating) n=1 Tax=Mycena belliarum TaxID=1033014 RepID=A0AAD6UF62_9AGAR|nr:glycosyl hydrolase family 61-domain-containing protein [Mycena belliae]
MKSLSILNAAAALLAEVSAHYTFPQLIVGGVNSSAWQYVRETNNWQDLNPLTDVSTTDVRCYSSAESGTSSTMSVAAGSTVGFTVDGNPANTYHPGVLNVYMAKAPAGTDVASWDGSGEVWFKIYEIPAVTDGLSEVNFPIPSETPSGQYLIRVEHIALHVASSFGGAQFYIACAQVEVTNGGTGTPGPLVEFPGEYTGNEPGILIDIYYPIPTSYTQAITMGFAYNILANQYVARPPGVAFLRNCYYSHWRADHDGEDYDGESDHHHTRKDHHLFERGLTHKRRRSIRAVRRGRLDRSDHLRVPIQVHCDES